MNLNQGTESSNKIESSSKKGRTMNNFRNKIMKKKIKDEKNIENSNENVCLKGKQSMNRSKISEKIQIDSAKKI